MAIIECYNWVSGIKKIQRMSITFFSAKSSSVRAGMAHDHNGSKVITVALMVTRKRYKACRAYPVPLKGNFGAFLAIPR